MKELPLYGDTEDFESEEDKFVLVARKSVYDSDGFTTDYSWYKNVSTGMNVFVFGDSDLYRPEDGEYDWEEEDDEVAEEWFDNYEGFTEDDHFIDDSDFYS